MNEVTSLFVSDTWLESETLQPCRTLNIQVKFCPEIMMDEDEAKISADLATEIIECLKNAIEPNNDEKFSIIIEKSNSNFAFHKIDFKKE